MKKQFLLAVMILVGGRTGSWAVPQYITYQGSIKQKGIPVTGPLAMQFTFVNADGSAIPNALPISTNVVVTNGLFAVQLALPNIDWSQLTPAVKVAVGSQQLSPPQLISSNLYAVVSQTVVDGAITQAKLAPDVQTGFIPVGAIMPFGGPTAPNGWLPCEGTSISRTNYSALFKVIGTVWGAGDGTTTFNLPDLRGRSPIGAGQGPGLTIRNLGIPYGEESHTMQIQEMPSHTHGIYDPLRGQFIVANPTGLAPIGWGINGTGINGYTSPSFLVSLSAGQNFIPSHNLNSGGDGSGNTVPLNVMQPSTAVTYIVKY